MYLMNRDIYECDFCGHTQKFDETDLTHGSMWGCEKCGRDFCEKCFVDRFGQETFSNMLQGALSGPNETDEIICPKCFAERHQEDT